MATLASERGLGRPATVLLHLVGGLLGLALVLGGARTLLDAAARESFTVDASYTGVTRLVVDDDNGDVELTGVPAGRPLRVRTRVTRGVQAPKRTATARTPP